MIKALIYFSKVTAICAGLLVPAVIHADVPLFQVGQWVWSTEDMKPLLQARAHFPELIPGVWVSTIFFDNGDITQRLALPPKMPGIASIAVVVRFDDSFHQAWDRNDDNALASLVGERLRRLLKAMANSEIAVRQIQLDYDAPVRQLPRWAGLLHYLSNDILKGRELWVTSLVAHMRAPNYGKLFQNAVSGHILQVFDTGDQFSPEAAERVFALAEQQNLPFTLGIGAFERRRSNGDVTDHAAWFSILSESQKCPHFRGVWVFPGGNFWHTYLKGSQ